MLPNLPEHFDTTQRTQILADRYIYLNKRGRHKNVDRFDRRTLIWPANKVVINRWKYVSACWSIYIEVSVVVVDRDQLFKSINRDIDVSTC